MKPRYVRFLVLKTLVFNVSFLLFTIYGCQESPKASLQNQPKTTVIEKHSQYMFGTQKLKRYQFPTHINDLVIDRAQSAYSEVFMVVIEPNKAPPFHKHDDTEQIFYVLEGTGVLTIGDQKEQYPVKPGDVVRIPVSTYHSIKADGKDTLHYLCVDCFGEKPKTEPTWDDHVKTMCTTNGWDYDKVVSEAH